MDLVDLIKWHNVDMSKMPPEGTLSNALIISCYGAKRSIDDQMVLAFTTFKQVIEELFEWRTARDLIQHLNEQMKIFIKYEHNEIYMNVFKRVLKVIKEEYFGLSPDELFGKEPFELNAVELRDDGKMYTTELKDLKENILTGIDGVVSELENSVENIVKQSLDVIESGDAIMVFGYDVIVSKMLAFAIEHKKFEVIIAEGVSESASAKMSQELNEAKVPNIRIYNESIHNFMSKTSKVLVSAELICAEKGVQVPSGFILMALSSEALSRPIIVCTGTHRLQDRFDIIEKEEEDQKVNYAELENLLPLTNSKSEYIPLTYVRYFLLNHGLINSGLLPTSIKETYHLDDF